MKSQGFKRLRITVTAGVAGVTLLPAVVPEAHAATLPISERLTGGSLPTAVGGRWKLDARAVSSVPFSTGATAFGLYSGSYFSEKISNSSVVFDSSMFQNFGTVHIGTRNYNPPAGAIDDSTSHTVITPPQTLSRVKVSERYDFVGGRTVRLLITIKNPGRHAVTRDVSVGTNLYGSSTVDSSGGDPNVNDPTDAWYVHDASGSGGVGVARGDSTTAGVGVAPGGLVLDTYTLRIKPHKTVRLLYFIFMTKTTAAASAFATGFTDATALANSGFLSGITAKQRSQIKNWTTLPPPS